MFPCKLLLAAAVAACAISTQQTPRKPLADVLAQPALMKWKGRMINTDNVGAVILYHRDLDYGQSMKENIIKRVQKAFKLMQQRFKDQRSSTGIIRFIETTKMLEAMLKYALKHVVDYTNKRLDLSHHSKPLTQDTSRNNRNRRDSWLGIVGTGMKTLFGVAKDDDVIAVQQQLRDVTTTVHASIHHLQHAMQAVDEIEQAVHNIETQFTEEQSEIDTFALFMRITSLCTQLQQKVDEKARIMQQMASLYAGHVTPETLPPNTLNDLLNNLTNSKPIPFDKVFAYYPFLTVKVLNDCTIIKIPLMPTNDKFYHVFQTIPLPITNPTIKLPSTKPFLFLQDTKSEILEDGLLLDDEELVDCVHNMDTFVCTKLRLTSLASPKLKCQLSLISGTTEGCEFYDVEDTTPTTYETDTDEFVFFFKHTKLTTNCEGVTRQNYVEAGLYHIQKRCDLQADGFTYKPLIETELTEFDMESSLDISTDLSPIPIRRLNLTQFTIHDSQVRTEDTTWTIHTTYWTNYSIATPVLMIIQTIISFGFTKWYTDRKYTRSVNELPKRITVVKNKKNEETGVDD